MSARSTSPAPSRVVHHADAIPWLRAHAPLAGASVVTSLPDVSEVPALSLDAWRRVTAATPDYGRLTVMLQVKFGAVDRDKLKYPIYATRGPINSSHVTFRDGKLLVNIEDAGIPSMFASLTETRRFG